MPRTLNELWFLCPKQKTNLKICWKKQQPNRRTARPFSVRYWNPPSGCRVRRRRARLWLKIARLIYSTGKKKTAPASFLFLPR
ncbi:enhanced serine sensitivity protein SseB [Escherichia coli MS 69-1]|nr:enhanced serine sensitivity protein SseB [Escherichia coli MS 69-1]